MERMRYIKLFPPTTEEKSITGTLNIVRILLQFKSQIKDYQNQLKLYHFIEKIKEKDQLKYLVISEEDWSWSKGALEKCDYTGLNVGGILDTWDNPPNVKPEDYVEL